MIQILLRLVITGNDTQKQDGTICLRFDSEVNEEENF